MTRNPSAAPLAITAIVLVLIGSQAIACTAEVRVIRPSFIHLSDGDSVLVVATGPIFEPTGDTGLMFEYHTYLPIDDSTRLLTQALRLWPAVYPKAESLGRPFVVLLATTRIAAPPAPQPRVWRDHGFVFEKRTDGRWYRLQDSVPLSSRVN